MFETLSVLPVGFWAVVLLLAVGALNAWGHRKDGTGLPILATLGTVAAWYVGDAFYNDYANNHAKLFDAATLEGAWWQVALFLTAFLLLVKPIHQAINRSYLDRQSGIQQMLAHGVEQAVIQQQLKAIFYICATVWALLFSIALVILKGEIVHYLFPFWGYKASPWSHGQIGRGFDFLSILALHLNLLVASLFGVVAALLKDSRLRRYALVLCLLTWPYFIFDRTRNTMLTVVIPAVLSWVFLRLRLTLWKKVAILAICFCVVNFWMKFVIANRSHTSIVAAFQQNGLSMAGDKKVHNEGLNMFEELCWISTFIDNGSYQVNWGARYFAELVNPIPRALWHNKPLIGLDYAIARGHHVTDANGAVDTTIATGLIGQGVVNFGRFGGPLAAALLMSLWVAWLARLDLNIQALGRLPLYSLGLILTFNLGRDITLITLYPFLFGTLAVWWWDRHRRHAPGNSAAQVPRRPARGPTGASVRPAPFAPRQTMGGFVTRRRPRIADISSRHRAGGSPSSLGDSSVST